VRLLLPSHRDNPLQGSLFVGDGASDGNRLGAGAVSARLDVDRRVDPPRRAEHCGTNGMPRISVVLLDNAARSGNQLPVRIVNLQILHDTPGLQRRIPAHHTMATTACQQRCDRRSTGSYPTDPLGPEGPGGRLVAQPAPRRRSAPPTKQSPGKEIVAQRGTASSDCPDLSWDCSYPRLNPLTLQNEKGPASGPLMWSIRDDRCLTDRSRIAGQSGT